MAECGEKAILVVTMTPQGTATNVARRREELTCRLPHGHAGKHRDDRENQDWIAERGDVPMILRHEDEVR